MFFHVSKNLYEDGTIFKPRVPLNKMTKEESETKRICTSRSLDGCLVAVGGFDIHDIIYVYTCEFSGGTHTPTFKQVPDVPFTGEEWILSDTKITKLWKLEITAVHERTHNEMSLDTYSYKFI